MSPRSVFLFTAAMMAIIFGGFWLITQIAWRFSFDGQMEARFNELIWSVDIRAWSETPVYVSDQVCPMVDADIRTQPQSRPGWRLLTGYCLFG
jgi:hypothetical protein